MAWRISPSKFTLYNAIYCKSIVNRSITSLCREVGSNIELSCVPLSTLMDKNVDVNIRGLVPNQKVSLQSILCNGPRNTYSSLAHYVADNQGKVCLSTQPSVGGSYTGVEPMGFVWSLKPKPGQKTTRLMCRDVTKPYVVNIDVLAGHIDGKSQEASALTPLTSLTIERHFMGPGVRRIEVREGRIRGSLFLPPGDGPFQGVMDIHGAFSGLVESKAALLAANGFAAFSLAYTNYEDLPRLLREVELEYFQEAANWLKNHPQVIPGGIGLLGLCKGADMSLLLTATNPLDVAATVCISGHHCLFAYIIKYQGECLEYIGCKHSELTVEPDGSLNTRDCFPDDWQGDITDNPKATPVENIHGPLLLVYGADDRDVNTELSASKIFQRMEAFGKGAQCSLLGYHGTGHLIEPPYTPHCSQSFIKDFDASLAWGGETKAHASAQEHAWAKILSFLKKNVRPLNK